MIYKEQVRLAKLLAIETVKIDSNPDDESYGMDTFEEALTNLLNFTPPTDETTPTDET